MTTKFKLTRAAELESLPVLRDFIKQVCEARALPADFYFGLQLSIDEACANIIEHGYVGMDPGSVILEIEFMPTHVRLTLTDFGHPFEPTSAPAPDLQAPLEERTAGGFGLYFIYSMMDHVDYQTDAEGNRLILTKKLPS